MNLTPQVFVKCTGYLLGEYGPLLAAGGEAPLADQFRLLQDRFVAASPETKARRGGWPRVGATRFKGGGVCRCCALGAVLRSHKCHCSLGDLVHAAPPSHHCCRPCC